MDLKLALLDKLLTAVLAVGVVWFLAKSLLRNKLNPQHKHSQGGHQHLDDLIKQQKLRMGRNELAQKVSGHASTARTPINHFKQMQQRLEDTGQETSEAYESVSFLLNIENDNQWGDGKVLQSISKQLSARTGIFFPSRTLQQAYNTAYAAGTFNQSDQSDALVNKAAIIQLLELCTISLGIKNALNEETEFLKHLAKTEKLAPKQIRQALAHWIENCLEANPFLHLENVLTRPGSDFDIYIDKLESQLDFFFKQNLVNNGQPVDIEVFLDSILESIRLVRSFSLPEKLSTQDQTSYYQHLFDLEVDFDADQVKQAYNKLVVEKHPDRFSSLKLTANLEKRVHDNFTVIQEAYDYLKSN